MGKGKGKGKKPSNKPTAKQVADRKEEARNAANSGLNKKRKVAKEGRRSSSHQRRVTKGKSSYVPPKGGKPCGGAAPAP